MNTAPNMGSWAIARHSKSFAMASTLLPKRSRYAAQVVYAWCRRADDAVDLCDSGNPQAELARLEEELSQLYRGQPSQDPVLRAFAQVVERFEIPEAYPRDLLRGMRMDVDGYRYSSWEDLFTYCYCVASTVGLMMCHVMGVRASRAHAHAAHLGIAMQLTNICRDVAEDWSRQRLYLPTALLAESGAESVAASLNRPLAPSQSMALRQPLRRLLHVADAFYASGDSGLRFLDVRCAAAIAAARRVYSSIGDVIAANNYDVLAPRAVVPTARKLTLCASALTRTLFSRTLGRFWGFEEVAQRASIHAALPPELPETAGNFVPTASEGRLWLPAGFSGQLPHEEMKHDSKLLAV